MNRTQSRSLSGSSLKIIAIVLMVIDHFAATILAQGVMRLPAIQADTGLWESLRGVYKIMRLLGRASFPIFCFLLVEGFLHTSDVKKYAKRLFLFALISEIPFDLAVRGHFFVWNSQNVYFTLFLGLVSISLMDRMQKAGGKYANYSAFPLLLGLAAGHLFHTDYGLLGVFLIEVYYLFRFDRKMQILAGALAHAYEPTSILAAIPLWFYNGKRGIPLKYLFYWFYPVHLLLFAGITFLIQR